MQTIETDLRQRLQLARLPAMPEILLKLLELCQTDGAGMAEIARLVGNDVAVTTRVLAVANSAAWQRGGQKVGLMLALSRLGSETIKTLVMGESVRQTFATMAGAAGWDLRHFWSHALTSAVIAREIARATDYPQHEEAWLAGLLHDVGRLALRVVAPQTCAAHFVAADDAALCLLEQQQLQLDHAEAGAWLAQRWQLDSFLADAIRYHHAPLARIASAPALVRIVHLAHRLAEQDGAAGLAPDAGALCGVADEALLLICQSAAAQVARTAGFLGIDVSAPPAQQAAVAPAAVGAAQRGLQEALHERSLVAELARSLGLLPGEAQQLALLRNSVGLEFQLQDSLVLLPDAAGQLLVAASFSEAMERLDGFAVALEQDGTIAAAVQQRRLLCSAGPGLVPGLAEEQLLRALQAESLLCLPLLLGEQCLGLLVAGLPALQVPEVLARERLLLAMAGAAATALAVTQGQRGDVALQLTALREEQALQARKMAHEINNPLAIVKNYLGVLDDKLKRSQPVQAELLLLGEEIDRVGKLVNARAGVPGNGPAFADINQVITRLQRLLRDSAFLPEGVELRVRLPERSCLIQGEADTLQQILLNLVKNSVEALAQGGRIQIVNQGQVQRAGKACYVLVVFDNGPGIPAEQRSRLFAPLPSSKPGSNRGLGLSIVHGLVAQLGGSIHCTSSSSRGTAFDICLPVPELRA